MDLSASWYGSFRPKSKAPPIFSSTGRSSAALLDKRIREASSWSELSKIVEERLGSFDEGNSVIALCSGAKLLDERHLAEVRREPWAQLLVRLRRDLASLEPRGLSMVAYACAKLALSDHEMLRELATASIRKAGDFGATDVSKICWAFAKLDVLEEEFWEKMADAVVLKAATARHVELSMIAWAFGTAQKGHEKMLQELARCAQQQLQELTPQCLANLATAYARRDVRHRELFGAICRRSHVVISDFSDFDVTNLCWALARAGEVDRELFEALAEHTVSGRFVKRYSAEMAVQMAWAYAVAEVRHEKLFEELTDFISRHASVFEAQYVASCLWAYGSLELRNEAAWEALARECKGGRLWKFPPKALSACCWAFVRVAYRDLELLQDMLQVASERLPEFDAQGLLNFLSAVVVLREEGRLRSEASDLEEPLESSEEMLAQLLLDGYSELSGRRLTAQEAKGFARLRGRAPWELRRLPFGRWLASMEGSGQLLRYLPALEQCYDTVAQVQQTYTVGGKLDPLLYKDLGILEPHRVFFQEWFERVALVT